MASETETDHVDSCWIELGLDPTRHPASVMQPDAVREHAGSLKAAYDAWWAGPACSVTCYEQGWQSYQQLARHYLLARAQGDQDPSYGPEPKSAFYEGLRDWAQLVDGSQKHDGQR